MQHSRFSVKIKNRNLFNASFPKKFTMEEEKTEKAEWIKIKKLELDKIIIQLHKEGNLPDKIGLILRDKHGIPKAKLISGRIGSVLRKNGIEIDSNAPVKKKIAVLESHLLKHRHDYTAKRSLNKKRWLVVKS